MDAPFSKWLTLMWSTVVMFVAVPLTVAVLLLVSRLAPSLLPHDEFGMRLTIFLLQSIVWGALMSFILHVRFGATSLLVCIVLLVWECGLKSVNLLSGWSPSSVSYVYGYIIGTALITGWFVAHDARYWLLEWWSKRNNNS